MGKDIQPVVNTAIAMENIIAAVSSKTATKAEIEKLAQECANHIKDPLDTTLKLKPVQEFFNTLKDILSKDALEKATVTPESKRRLQNLTYDVITRKTFKFEDEFIDEMKKVCKERERELIEEGDYKLTETPYLRINIPKE
jgi:cysteinyl-tRNA synthetase|tara:strand:+ start:6615 stop:7037 length:423 start_codon:yes stop_codon:yes gene_type:complete